MKNDSVIQEVVQLVAFIRARENRVLANPVCDKAEVLEIFEDIITFSDNLMSCMLASPLTGRMNVNPSIGITDEEITDSLAETLGV